MSVRVITGWVIAAALTVSPAVAATYGMPTRSSAASMHQSRHNTLRLPKELKIVWRQEEHARLKAMPKEQRHGWLKRRWEAMNDHEKRVKMAELEAKWRALPADAREKILQKKQQRREARHAERIQQTKNGAQESVPASAPPRR